MRHTLIKNIIDIIYPVRCPICGVIVNPKKELICHSCRDKLHYVKEPRCKKCSKPILYEEKEYCSDCEQKNYYFKKGFSVWTYNEAMKYSLADFKYHNKKENARFYTQEIIRLYGNTILKLSPDVIVPVPIHRSKRLERGYNQAEILAKGIGKELELPVMSGLLLRSKKTLPQKQLSDKGRLRNLQEAFSFNVKVSENFPGKINRVLLVDDIYTTGSTVEACTNVLIAHDIKEIYFVTVCIGKGF